MMLGLPRKAVYLTFHDRLFRFDSTCLCQCEKYYHRISTKMTTPLPGDFQDGSDICGMYGETYFILPESQERLRSYLEGLFAMFALPITYFLP